MESEDREYPEPSSQEEDEYRSVNVFWFEALKTVARRRLVRA